MREVGSCGEACFKSAPVVSRNLCPLEPTRASPVLFEDVEILDHGSRHRRRLPGTETTVKYGYEPSISFATHTARPGRHLGVINVTRRCLLKREAISSLVSSSCHALFATALDPVGVSALFCVSHSPEAMKFNAIGNASLKVSDHLSAGADNQIGGGGGVKLLERLMKSKEPSPQKRNSASFNALQRLLCPRG